VDEETLRDLPQSPVIPDMDLEPTWTEVDSAVRAMKNGKAAGCDGIPAEVLKAGGDTMTEQLLKLFVTIWRSENIPSDLRDAIIVTIFKKGDKSQCGDCRGISLLSIAGKVLARILVQRLSMLAETVLPETQCGLDQGGE
jgi:hypothetical protein